VPGIGSKGLDTGKCGTVSAGGVILAPSARYCNGPEGLGLGEGWMGTGDWVGRETAPPRVFAYRCDSEGVRWCECREMMYRYDSVGVTVVAEGF
jgi:hypothetical protein